MPFRAEAPFLLGIGVTLAIVAVLGINALSGWGSFSTDKTLVCIDPVYVQYQCPFGLGLHFYD